MARFRCDAPLPELDDPVVPTGVLLGPDAAGLFATAVDAAGGTLRVVTPRQATYHPGRSLTVRYDATIAWKAGETTNASLVAMAADQLPNDAAILDDGQREIAVWRVPHDPYLPGLAPALDEASVCRLLRDLGAPVEEARSRLRAYRPGRRAVVEIAAPGTRLYLKVVRPHDVESLHRRHVLLAQHVPVPRSLGWSDELGLVALQAVGGRTLRSALNDASGLPGPGALHGLLEALPESGGRARARAGWQSARFASVLAAVLPDMGARVEALSAAIVEAEAAAVAAEPLVPVHGDFHEAQLMVDGGRVTGLLDVDTFGLGFRVDDLATLLGHLAVLALASPRQARIERYGAELLQVFDRLVDPARLREAVAATVLGLATGPFRVLERGWPTRTRRCVVRAEQWFASASRVRGRVAT